MNDFYTSDNRSALDSLSDAQKIAFGPFVFQATRVLRDTGILKLLHDIGEAGLDAETIAAELKIPLYGVKVLADAGLSIGVLYLNDKNYSLTKTGHFIVTDKMTNVNMDFVHDVCYQGMFHLEEAVRTQRPAGLKVFGDWDTIYKGLSQLPEKVKESWFGFDHFYSDKAFDEVIPVLFEEEPDNILDVGGNTGKFSIRCASYSETVKITILDHPGQLEMAKENIKEQGFEERINTYPIDLLDHSKPYPKPYGIIWMSQFLDCFGGEDIVELLLKARDALSEDGSIFVLDTYWDRQRFEISSFCLNMTSLYFTAMANGTSRMYHSGEMISYIEKAGLRIVKEIDGIGLSHTLIECKK